MKLTPRHEPGKNGRREYRTPDRRWRLVRTRSGPQPNSARWEVHEATDQPEEWSPSAAFAKRRDARLFLEDRISQCTASRPKPAVRVTPPPGRANLLALLPELPYTRRPAAVMVSIGARSPTTTRRPMPWADGFCTVLTRRSSFRPRRSSFRATSTSPLRRTR